MILALFGPPGCGKGTQARYLVEKYGFTHLAAGDILRAEVKSGSEFGRKLQDFMNTGGLLSDDVIIDVMKSKIDEQIAANKHILLDGFPRSAGQLEFMRGYINRLDTINMAMIRLDVDLDRLLERISGRVVCKGCGATYGAMHSGIERCEVCGGTSFEKRSDDNAETFMRRLDEYKKTTLPMIESAEDMFCVDGSLSPADVSAALDKIIGGILV